MTVIPADDILDLLRSLVDKSLVVYEERDGVGRYRLLETVRQYAQDRLQESGEDESVRSRAASWFLAFAEEAEPQLTQTEQVLWLERLETEHDNLRASLSWYAKWAEGAEEGLRLAAALSWFWTSRGHCSEGRQWLGQALDNTKIRGESQRQEGSAVQEALARRAAALSRAGKLADHQNDYPAARTLYEEGLAIRRRLDDQRGIANSLRHLAGVVGIQGDLTETKTLLDESLILWRRLGDHAGTAYTLDQLAELTVRAGDYTAARNLYEESLLIHRGLGNQQGVADALGNLGWVVFNMDDPTSARAMSEESVAIWRRLGHPNGIAFSLVRLGGLVSAQGDYAWAQSLFEESLTLYRQLGNQSAIALTLSHLGEVASLQGDYSKARVLLKAALTLHRQLGNQWGCTDAIEIMAAVAHGQNQSSMAGQLMGSVASLHESIGIPLSPAEQENMDKITVSAREALGEDPFAAAWDAGRAMTMNEAIEFALETPIP